MVNLIKKTKMDEEARRKVKRVIDKIESVRNFYRSNTGEGSTTLAAKAMSQSKSSILLTGSKEQAKRALKPKGINISRSFSWSHAYADSYKGKRGPLVVDNSFMEKMLLVVHEVISFLFSEVNRLKDQNNTLREANSRLSTRVEEAYSENKKLKEEKENLANRIEELRAKLNGKAE